LRFGAWFIQDRSLSIGDAFSGPNNNAVLLTINGEQRDVSDDASLDDMVRLLELPRERIAIELNHTVIRRAEWPATKLREGDKVEIVHFVGGGEL
jgi:thiamine biosynthesis protein ThiS